MKLHYGLVFLLFLTLSSFPLTMRVSRAAWELQQTQQLLEKHLEESLSTLHLSVEEIATSPALLAWTPDDTTDSLQHFIDLQNNPHINTILVTDANCKLLAASATSSLNDRFCDLKSSSKLEVSWLIPEQPVLVFQKRVASQSNIQVVGLISLDVAWLKRTQPLGDLVEKYDLMFLEDPGSIAKSRRLVTFKSEVLKTEFTAQYSHWAGPLISTQGSLQKAPEIAFSLLAALSLLFGLLLLYEAKRKKRREAASIREIQSWLAETPISPAPESANPVAAKLLPLLYDYRIKVERLNGLATNYQKEIENLRKSDSRKILTLQSLEEDQILSQSFTHFLQVCSDALTTNLQRFLGQATHIEDAHNSHIPHHPQSLFGLAKSWKSELKEKSARKFLRTLSERILPDGSSELDQVLNKIQDYSGAVSNQTLKTSQLFRRLKKQGTAMSDLVGALRRASSLKQNDNSRTLEDIVADVTYILQRVYRLRSDRLVNFSDQNYYVKEGEGFFFFCLFFQCYYTFLKQSSKLSENNLISIKYRKKESDLVLLLQVPAYKSMLSSAETTAGIERIRGILKLKAGELYFMNKDEQPTFMLIIPCELRATDPLNQDMTKENGLAGKARLRRTPARLHNQRSARLGE
ncbi:MAG: PDC sensor domain-containing protein [Oligoflexales bacterium]